jgi:hypothetical protein
MKEHLKALTAETWRLVAHVQQLAILVLAEPDDPKEEMALVKRAANSNAAIRILLTQIAAEAARIDS